MRNKLLLLVAVILAIKASAVANAAAAAAPQVAHQRVRTKFDIPGESPSSSAQGPEAMKVRAAEMKQQLGKQMKGIRFKKSLCFK